jgi:hypothetical protein
MPRAKKRLPKKKTPATQRVDSAAAQPELEAPESEPQAEPQPELSPEGERSAESPTEPEVEFESVSHVEPDAEADITSIYDIDGEGPVDMSRMEQKLGRGRKALVFGGIAFVLLLLAAAFLGYRVFSQDFGTPQDQGTVDFSMTAEPNQVASGDVVTIVIDYQNNKTAELRAGEIEVFYPDGFFFESATVSPIDQTNKTFLVEKVPPGTGGQIRITGQLVGRESEQKEFSALFTYQPENFFNDFQESARTSVTVTASTVSVVVEVPPQVQSGQEMTYKATFTNTANRPLRNVKLLMEYPEGFTCTGSTLPLFAGDNEWRLDQIDAGGSQTLELTGTLDGESGETKEFRIQLGLVELDNSFNVQLEQTSLVVIVNPEIELEILAPTSVDAGETVPLTVKVKNSSEAEIKQAVVKLAFAGDLATVTEHSFEPIDLDPLEDTELNYDLVLKSQVGADARELTVTATVPTATVEGQSVNFPNEESVTMKLKGSFDVRAEGRYFDDDLTKIGDGPLPPKVNHETSYVIRWFLLNGVNPVNGITVTTTLPDDVVFVEEASSGVKFDSATRQVSFSTASMAAGETKTVQFTVTVSPTNDDINKLMVLTEQTIVSAVDSVTGEDISLQLNRITTDLPNDEGAKGKGVVEG